MKEAKPIIAVVDTWNPQKKERLSMLDHIRAVLSTKKRRKRK